MDRKTMVNSGVHPYNQSKAVKTTTSNLTGTSINAYYTLWDYNGYIYAFILIEGENVNRINFIFSKSSTIYQMSCTQYMPSKYPLFFAVNSYDISSPFRLSSGTWNWTMTFYDSSNNLLDSSSQFSYTMKNTLSTPSITNFNSNTNIITVNAGSSSANRCYLQIEKATRPSTVNGFTVTQRDYFYTAAMKGIESGKYWEGIPAGSFPQDTKAYIRKWDYPYINAKVVFDNAYKLSSSGTTYYANISTSTKNTCFSYVQQAINAINNMSSGLTINLDSSYETMPSNIVMVKGDLSGNGQKLVDNYSDVNPYYDLVIRFGIRDSMYSSNQNYNGNWQIWAWGDHPEWGIGTSLAHIASDITLATDAETVKHVVFEEILQSLGAGNDSWSEPDSLFFDPPDTNPESYNELDSSVLKQLMLCESGWDAFDCINNLDTPCLLYRDAGTSIQFDLSKLNAGSYKVTVWIANEDDYYSLKSNVYDITISNNRPNNWSWTYPKVSGGSFNLTASEWNNFTARINQFRAYKGLSEYSFATAVTGNPFTATMYNQARLAIQGISGYGGYIPTVSSGQKITAYMMNILESELNAIT